MDSGSSGRIGYKWFRVFVKLDCWVAEGTKCVTVITCNISRFAIATTQYYTKFGIHSFKNVNFITLYKQIVETGYWWGLED